MGGIGERLIEDLPLMDIGDGIGLAKTHSEKERPKPQLTDVQAFPRVDPAAADKVLEIAQVLPRVVAGEIVDGRGLGKEAAPPHLELSPQWKIGVCLALVLGPLIAGASGLVQPKIGSPERRAERARSGCCYW